MSRAFRAIIGVVLAACGAAQAPAPSAPPPAETAAQIEQIERIAAMFSAYTPARAEQDGYKADGFCIDAASFSLPASRGAMGFHSTNEALLRGPIDPNRPQAIMFDASGRALGVEYEILTGVAPQAPQLFGRTFTKLPAHPGVSHGHYALHVWFVENPEGRFSDFNPRVSCPAGSKAPGVQTTMPPPEHGEGH